MNPSLPLRSPAEALNLICLRKKKAAQYSTLGLSIMIAWDRKGSTYLGHIGCILKEKSSRIIQNVPFQRTRNNSFKTPISLVSLHLKEWLKMTYYVKRLKKKNPQLFRFRFIKISNYLSLVIWTSADVVDLHFAPLMQVLSTLLVSKMRTSHVCLAATFSCSLRVASQVSTSFSHNHSEQGEHLLIAC